MVGGGTVRPPFPRGRRAAGGGLRNVSAETFHAIASSFSFRRYCATAGRWPRRFPRLRRSSVWDRQRRDCLRRLVFLGSVLQGRDALVGRFPRWGGPG